MGPSIPGKPDGGTSKCSFHPLSQATPSPKLPLTAFPQEPFLSRTWPAEWVLDGRAGGQKPDGGSSGRGPGPWPRAAGRRPPRSLRNRLCERPCPPPSLHSLPSFPSSWISPAAIKLPIKTNFPLIIEKRKTKEKAPKHRWLCSDDTRGWVLPCQLCPGSYHAAHRAAQTLLCAGSLGPPPTDPQNTPRPGHRADSGGGRRGWGWMAGTEKGPDPTHKSIMLQERRTEVTMIRGHVFSTPLWHGVQRMEILFPIGRERRNASGQALRGEVLLLEPKALPRFYVWRTRRQVEERICP